MGQRVLPAELLNAQGFYVNEEDEEPACLEQNPFAPGTFVTRQVGGRALTWRRRRRCSTAAGW